MKKNNDLFDVTMGSYDGAEVCELVGIYLLHQVKTAFPEISFGLYRDDGLGCYKNMPGPKTERTKKAITKIFHNNGLEITINMNMRQSNFLDVTMFLETGKYQPYRKPGNAPLYINQRSNHPPNITIQFSKHRSNFQKKLTLDRKSIQSSEDVYVPADKSTNIYKMSANDNN
jgi:hypothetical protein